MCFWTIGSTFGGKLKKKSLLGKFCLKVNKFESFCHLLLIETSKKKTIQTKTGHCNFKALINFIRPVVSGDRI